MNNEKKERIKSFVNKIFVEEIRRLQDSNFHYFSFIIIGEAIETLGGLLDNKPIKAKAQSMKRFSKCIDVLMPKKYSIANSNNYLYDKLRNQMVHSFIPSSSLILTNRTNNIEQYKHLEFVDGKMVLISEDFYEDILYASKRLLYMLENEKIKPKSLADFNYF